MANKPKTMLQVRRILQLLKEGTSKRQVAKIMHISRNTVDTYTNKFSTTGKSLEELYSLSEGDLCALITTQPKQISPNDPRSEDIESRMSYFLGELKKRGVTRELLWREYLQEVPDGYSYSQFCDRLSVYLERSELVMHFDHKPAYQVQFDFAGGKFTCVDTETGELTSYPVLVFVLPYSGFTYAEALPNASQEQVFKAMNNCLQYLEGVPGCARSDNMKQFVYKSNRYEPVFSELCNQWALHYNITLMATRVGKPKDKPSVEKGVDLTYKRLYAPLRNMRFSGLNEINHHFRKQLEIHNRLPMQKREQSRYDVFTRDEKPLLKPLPMELFEIKHTTKAKVQKNYHVILGEDWHQYSVPYQLHGKRVTIIYDSSEVEIYLDRNRVALHRRSYRRHGYTTLKEHMPEKHRRYHEMLGWDGPYFLKQAGKIGINTREAFQLILNSKVFTEQTYNSCLGILRLANQYGDERVEAACRRALAGNHVTYRIVNNILSNNMDQLPLSEPTLFTLPEHENLRGAKTYK